MGYSFVVIVVLSFRTNIRDFSYRTLPYLCSANSKQKKEKQMNENKMRMKCETKNWKKNLQKFMQFSTMSKFILRLNTYWRIIYWKGSNRNITNEVFFVHFSHDMHISNVNWNMSLNLGVVFFITTALAITFHVSIL